MAVSTTTANGPQSSGGGGSWGSITGTLSAQTDLQTALDAKAPLTSPAFATSARFSYGTASTVPYWNASKDLVSSAVTPTELGYLTGVTSALQTQLDAKAADSAVVKLTGTQTVAGAKTFSSDMALTSGTASTTTGTGALVVTGGIGASGAVNHAGTYRCTNTTDSTSISSGSAVFSGGVGITKTLYVGTGIGVTTGNVLITSGNVGRDTGVSGSLTDCPTNVFCNSVYVKTNLSWAANSATTGLSTSVDSGTSITFKSGATSLLGISSTQLNAFKRIHFGTLENTRIDFATATVTTTNNTATSAYTFATTGLDNWIIRICFYATCRRSDSGTEYGQFAKSFLFSRESGVTTLRSTQDIHPDGLSTLTTATVQGAVSGTDAVCQVVGETSKTLKWTWYVFTTIVST